jgi:hypothetical protein
MSKKPEQSYRVMPTYYHRQEMDGLAVEVGFKTKDELYEYMRAQDPTLEQRPLSLDLSKERVQELMDSIESSPLFVLDESGQRIA